MYVHIHGSGQPYIHVVLQVKLSFHLRLGPPVRGADRKARTLFVYIFYSTCWSYALQPGCQLCATACICCRSWSYIKLMRSPIFLCCRSWSHKELMRPPILTSLLQIVKSQKAHAPTHFDVFVADREVTKSSCTHPFACLCCRSWSHKKLMRSGISLTWSS